MHTLSVARAARHAVYTASCAALTASIWTDLPASPTRAYCAWGLSPTNPYHTQFSQVLGLHQLVHLTVTLFADVLPEALWPHVYGICGPLNTYLTYEVYSDNLALDLAGTTVNDRQMERRHLLLAFNAAMDARLDGSPVPASHLLADQRDRCAHISLFETSLAPAAYHTLGTAWSRTHHHPLQSIEYGLWPFLVANIESAVALVHCLPDGMAREVVRTGLRQRYAAITGLLQHTVTTREQRLAFGRDAILVIPTLAVYVATLAHQCSSSHAVDTAWCTGLLPSVLADAATLVRLTNDLGTALVCASPAELTGLFHAMTHAAQHDPQPRFDAFLAAYAACDARFARLHKDVVHGEWNIAIDPIRAYTDVPTAIDIFGAQVQWYAAQYHTIRAQLQHRLATLRATLGNEVISAMIWHFVTFHETMYRHDYRNHAGEYAIAP